MWTVEISVLSSQAKWLPIFKITYFPHFNFIILFIYQGVLVKIDKQFSNSSDQIGRFISYMLIGVNIVPVVGYPGKSFVIKWNLTAWYRECVSIECVPYASVTLSVSAHSESRLFLSSHLKSLLQVTLSVVLTDNTYPTGSGTATGLSHMWLPGQGSVFFSLCHRALIFTSRWSQPCGRAVEHPSEQRKSCLHKCPLVRLQSCRVGREVFGSKAACSHCGQATTQITNMWLARERPSSLLSSLSL